MMWLRDNLHICGVKIFCLLRVCTADGWRGRRGPASFFISVRVSTNDLFIMWRSDFHQMMAFSRKHNLSSRIFLAASQVAISAASSMRSMRILGSTVSLFRRANGQQRLAKASKGQQSLAKAYKGQQRLAKSIRSQQKLAEESKSKQQLAKASSSQQKHAVASKSKQQLAKASSSYQTQQNIRKRIKSACECKEVI